MLETVNDEKGELIKNHGFKEKIISHKDRLTFAYRILIAIFILFVISMLINIIYPKTDIFDTCKTILPPIATLIIGYYFRESD